MNKIELVKSYALIGAKQIFKKCHKIYSGDDSTEYPIFKIEYFEENNIVTTSYIDIYNNKESNIKYYNAYNIEEALIIIDNIIPKCINDNINEYNINCNEFIDSFIYKEQSEDDYYEWAGEFYLINLNYFN